MGSFGRRAMVRGLRGARVDHRGSGARADRVHQRLRPQPADRRSRQIGLARLAARPLRTVDEDGAPLPIIQARYAVGDPDELAAEDEIEPNGTLKQTGRAFPAVDRGAKGDPLMGPGFNAKRLNGKRSAAEPYAYKSGRARSKIRATMNSIRAIR